MRRWPLFFLCLVGGIGSALAVPAPTALDALKVLPKNAPSQVAIMEAFEGQPMPERWYILLYDPKEENGIHEYVVANGELIASRAVSQFAETLTSGQVLGAGVVKVDSDRVAKIAQEFAQANSVNVSTFNYELKKIGAEAVPLWRVTCLGLKGELLGTLVITATRGTVVSHDGFATEPPLLALEKPEKPPEKPPEKRDRPDKPDKPKPSREEVADRRPAPPREDRPLPSPETQPADETDRRPGIFQRASGSLQRIFTGRE